MKIIVKNKKGEFIDILSIKEFEPFEKIFEKFNSVKEPLEANIFAINEKVSSSQLSRLKLNIEKLNFNTLNIYSNKRETVLSGKSLKINSAFVNEEDLKYQLIQTTSKKQQDTLHKGTIRSGERISSNGDLIIIGDVNPGAIVSAKKNVYVWGKLLGIALAGENGDRSSSISSLYLKPLQLRINEVVAIGPKDKPKSYYPEMAILENLSIVIKPFLVDNQNKSII